MGRREAGGGPREWRDGLDDEGAAVSLGDGEASLSTCVEATSSTDGFAITVMMTPGPAERVRMEESRCEACSARTPLISQYPSSILDGNPDATRSGRATPIAPTLPRQTLPALSPAPCHPRRFPGALSIPAAVGHRPGRAGSRPNGGAGSPPPVSPSRRYGGDRGGRRASLLAADAAGATAVAAAGGGSAGWPARPAGRGRRLAGEAVTGGHTPRRARAAPSGCGGPPPSPS